MNAGTVTQTLEDQAGNYNGTAGDVSAMSLALIGTYAQKLNRLIPSDDPIVKNTLVGASLRVVSESIADASVFGGGLDVGALWRQTEEIKPREITTLDALRQKASHAEPRIRDTGWRVGFVAQNLGVTTDQMMPINFRLGGGYIINDAFTANGRFTFAADALIPVDNNFKVSLGTEYALIAPSSKFAARIGYKIGNEIQDLDSMAGLTAGAGFAILVSGIRYQLDYAFVPYGDLGTTQRISLTLDFLTGKNAVAPLGHQAPARTAVSPAIVSPKPVKESKTTLAKKTEKKQENKVKAKPTPNKTPAPTPEPQPVAEPKVDKAKESRKFKDSMKRITGSIKAGMLPGITFERGTAGLTKEAQRALGQIGKQLEHFDYGKLVILGFAGDKKDLAQARAAAVERYLKMNFRYDMDRVETKAGERKKKPENSDIDVEVVPEK
jgi:outer membrane protein OmpA-like peptidoglycan-associated protein